MDLFRTFTPGIASIVRQIKHERFNTYDKMRPDLRRDFIFCDGFFMSMKVQDQTLKKSRVHITGVSRDNSREITRIMRADDIGDQRQQ